MSNNVSNKDLAIKIDNLIHSFHEYKILSESRLTYLETCMDFTKKELDRKADKEVVDNLKRRDYIVGGVNTIAAAIAAILGVNK